MPMGISGAPITYSKFMSKILGDLDFVAVYIYDICIFREAANQHMDHLKIVMQRLERVNIKLNLDKCQWFTNKVELLGHNITPEGIRPNPKKIEAIRKRQRPRNLRDLRSFLGMTNYYRNYE